MFPNYLKLAFIVNLFKFLLSMSSFPRGESSSLRRSFRIAPKVVRLRIQSEGRGRR